jgi:hypothetical protein
MGGRTDKQTERQTDKQMDGREEKQIYTDGRTNRNTEVDSEKRRKCGKEVN